MNHALPLVCAPWRLLPSRSQAVLFVAAVLAWPFASHAHGVVGKRFFPATIATDDPFVADELSLPTASTLRTGDEPATRETSVSGEFSKRLTSDFGISLGAEHQHLSLEGQPSLNGWSNVELGFKYQFYRNEASETLVSVGLGWEIGSTGSKAIADDFSTYTPTVFFGKGFGDLPDTVPYLKPVALTGTLGLAIPSRASSTTTTIDPGTGESVSDVEQHPRVLLLGFSIQYSLPYLQSFVKDVGLREPFSRLIPLVEVSLEKPLDRVDDRRVTGTVNPGVLWAGSYTQVGLEAIVPINRRSGHGVGAQLQLHFFLDDIFPQSIGRPLMVSAP